MSSMCLLGAARKNKDKVKKGGREEERQRAAM